MFSLATAAAPGRANEDYALVAPDLAIVVDGTGTPGSTGTPDGTGDPADDVKRGCCHGIPWYVRQLAVFTMAALVEEPGLALDQGLARGIQAVGRLHIYSCDLSSPNTPSAGIGILRVGPVTVDALALGGCVVIVDTAAGPQLTPDAPQLTTDGALRGAVRAATVAADPRAARQAQVNSYPRAQVCRVAALSAGAAPPVDGSGRYGWPEYLDLLDELGPGALIDQIRKVARRPDDATAIHATLAGHTIAKSSV